MKQELIDRISGEDDSKPMIEKLKSTDLAFFLAAAIKVKFGRGQDEFIGDFTGCDNSSITLENVQGPYASRAEYRVWNEEAFWPVLRHMDDMSVEEFEEAEAFDKLCGIKWYCERGLDCFGWIGEGLAIRVKYYHLKEGEIIKDGDEVEMSNTIHDPAKWIPASNTVGQTAPDPAYPSHRKYRRLIPA